LGKRRGELPSSSFVSTIQKLKERQRKKNRKGNFEKEKEKRSFRAVKREIRPKQENRRFESLLR
jgi:hypothetical protein